MLNGKDIGDLCKGSTADSDSVCGSSNLSSPANCCVSRTQKCVRLMFLMVRSAKRAGKSSNYAGFRLLFFTHRFSPGALLRLFVFFSSGTRRTAECVFCRSILFPTFRDTNPDKTLDLSLHGQSLKRVENILVSLLVELECNEARVLLVVLLLRSCFFLADKKSRPLLTIGAKRDIIIKAEGRQIRPNRFSR